MLSFMSIADDKHDHQTLNPLQLSFEPLDSHRPKQYSHQNCHADTYPKIDIMRWIERRGMNAFINVKKWVT